METTTKMKDLKELIKKANADLTLKGFTTVNVTESDWDNTVTVNINLHKRNPYGASIRQVKYLGDIENIGHWLENGNSDWYSHTRLMRCSKSAVSWLIGFAKENKDISFDLVLVE